MLFNPLVTNGISHPYHLDDSTFSFRGNRSVFFYSIFRRKSVIKENRIAQDVTPRFAASHLGLFCLPMSHKKDARLMWVKDVMTVNKKHKL